MPQMGIPNMQQMGGGMLPQLSPMQGVRFVDPRTGGYGKSGQKSRKKSDPE